MHWQRRSDATALPSPHTPILNLSLVFGHSLWLLALCALVAGALTYWSYRRTVPPLSAGRRLLLGALRFGALFLILFLLFEPILRRVTERARPPVVAVLLDNSESLRVTGAASGEAEGDTSAADPRDAVEAALRRAADANGAETRVFAFDQALRALPAEARAATDSLGLTGARTDIAAALSAVREKLRDENLRGIVLISDGRYNSGRNPLYAAERSPVPIHTVVVGDTARQRDVQIRRVNANEIAYVGTETPVEVGVRTEGFGGERVEVALVEGGEVIGSAPVTLPEGAAEVTADLSYTPSEEGLRRLSARVTRLDGEATFRNNVQPFAVRVLESKRRVLLLGAAPSPDVAAVRQLLEQGPNAEVEARVARGGGDFYGGPLPDSLAAYDALVLAGFPGASVPAEAARRIALAIENGDAPAFFLLTPQTDLQALARFFSDALPAWPDEVRQGTLEATFAPTAEAARHPVFSLLGEAEGAAPSAWRRLPPLQASQTRWQTSPDAQTLATAVVRGVDLDAPLLVVRRRAGARSAAFLGAGAWRWKNVPEGLEDAAALWPALFSNAVGWITAQEDDRPVRVEPTAETFGDGEPARLTGQVYDESLNPVEGASVEVVVTGPDGARYPQQMEALGSGRYGVEIDALPEGTYRYTAEAEKNGQTLGTDQGSFAVDALTLEYKETRADAALMRQIAARSGGTFQTARAEGGPPIRLASSEDALAPLVVEEEDETRLWHLWGFLAVIVALLAAEWFLRKRSGMV